MLYWLFIASVGLLTMLLALIVYWYLDHLRAQRHDRKEDQR
jgi:hypothetical protein